MHSLTALADPTRRRIIEMLAERDRTAGELGAAFTISAPAVSQHLRVLRDAGLVSVRKEAQRRVYALAPGGLDELDAWIAGVRRFWAARLDALAEAIERDEARRRE